MKIRAEKKVVTYALVDIPEHWVSFRVWENGVVEKWVPAETSGWETYFAWEEYYDEVKQAGLEVLK
jgi:hypothetical protein